MLLVTVFVRNNVFGLLYILFLLYASLVKRSRVLRHFSWVCGFLMAVFLWQYVALLGLPPVHGVLWLW